MEKGKENQSLKLAEVMVFLSLDTMSIKWGQIFTFLLVKMPLFKCNF